MHETVAPTTDSARPGRFLRGFRRRIATRLGPPRGIDQSRAERTSIARNLAWAVMSWAPDGDEDEDGDEDTLAGREVRSKERAPDASQDAPSIDRLRQLGEAVRDQLRGALDCEAIEQIRQSVELDLACLDRLAIESNHQHQPSTKRRPIPIRAVLRCRMSRARRTRRAATKKTAASTGDPDPEPSGDARARLRSVALLIEAASLQLHTPTQLSCPRAKRDAFFKDFPVGTIVFLNSGGGS